MSCARKIDTGGTSHAGGLLAVVEDLGAGDFRGGDGHGPLVLDGAYYTTAQVFEDRADICPYEV
ncbi:MAG: hypothetical protein JRH08_18285 [Deltaproteobacteria bacterium]|nr:hypothetical protein [Deltaproteobacteria bacterium]